MTIKGIKIGAISSAVPSAWESIQSEFCDNYKCDEKKIDKFIKNTGVGGRYKANERQTTADLCFIAAKELLKRKNIDKSKIGILVLITQTADYLTPASSFVLHHRLGLSQNCLTFDINLGCSGFTHGLFIVSSILKQSNCDYALMLCGDTCAREWHPERNNLTKKLERRLFGDSGTATLLVKDSTASDIEILVASDGSGYKTIIVPYELYRNPIIDSIEKPDILMNGIDVFSFSTTKASDMILELMDKNKTTPKDYDCLVLHQANELILDRIAKNTGFENDKNIKSIHKYGNTSSASIPNSLIYNYGDDNDGILHCLLCGFGVGLSWSAVDCYIEKKDILPQCYSDEYFDDGYYKSGR